MDILKFLECNRDQNMPNAADREMMASTDADLMAAINRERLTPTDMVFIQTKALTLAKFAMHRYYDALLKEEQKQCRYPEYKPL